MLAKDPVRRPRDGAAVLAALEALRWDGRSSGAPLPLAHPAGPALPGPPGAAAALVVALVVAAAGALLRGRGGRPVRRPPRRGRGRRDERHRRPGARRPLGPAHHLAGAVAAPGGADPRPRMLDLARQADHRNVDRIDEVVGLDLARRPGARPAGRPTSTGSAPSMPSSSGALDPGRTPTSSPCATSAPTKEGLLTLIDRISRAGAARAARGCRRGRRNGRCGSRRRSPPQPGGLPPLLPGAGILDRPRSRGGRGARARPPSTRLRARPLRAVRVEARVRRQPRRLEHERAALQLQDRLPAAAEGATCSRRAPPRAGLDEAEPRYRAR